MTLNALDTLGYGPASSSAVKRDLGPQERSSFLDSDSYKNNQKIDRPVPEAYDPQNKLEVEIKFVEGIKVISVRSEDGLVINKIPSDQAAEQYLTMQKKLSASFSASPAA